MKILGIILLVIIIAGVVYYFTQLKDRDGDGDIDLKDAGLTAKYVKEDIEEGVGEVKRRAKRVKEEIKDVADAVKEVGNQVGDVAKAAKGKPRTGRKPRSKKTKK
jgi:methyl-accepting chemotaxis protein